MKMCGSAWSGEGKGRERREVGRGGGRAGKQREGTSSYPRLAFLPTKSSSVFHHVVGRGWDPALSIASV